MKKPAAAATDLVCMGNHYIFYNLTTKKLDTHKSGGVVIPDGLGITKGLQSRVSLNDLILQGTLILSNTETTAGSVPSIDN